VSSNDTVNSAVLVFLSLTFLMWLIPTAWGGFIPGGWSIQAEMLHYAFFALVRKWRVEVILFFWILLAAPTIFLDKFLSRVDTDLGVLEGWRSQNLPSTLIFFLAGCIFFMLKDQSRREKLSIAARSLSAIAVIAALLVPLSNVKSGQIFSALGFVAFALALAYLVSRLNSWRWTLERVAKFSYFSYFFHFFLLDFLEWLYIAWAGQVLPFGQVGVGFAVLAATILVTFISTAIGSLSWRYFEKPAILAGERLAGRV
jgi:peptidoglycan/LPS O-acetylase OafA/YrhL